MHFINRNALAITICSLLPLPALAAIGAVDDTRQVPQDTAVVINVLFNDTSDFDGVEVVAISAPQHGTVTRVADGLRYQPEAGYYGSDSFTYTIQNSEGEQDTAQVQINVTPGAGLVSAASIAQAALRTASNVVRNHREAVSLYMDSGSYAALNNQTVIRQGELLGGAAGDDGLAFGGMFLSVNSRNGEQDTSDMNNGDFQKGFDDNLTGFTLGADALWGRQWTGGLALGVSSSKVEFTDGLDDFDMDEVSMLAFGSFRQKAFTLQAQLGYSELDYSFEFADSAGHNHFAFLKGQYAFNTGNWRIVPAAALNYQNQYIDAYKEVQSINSANAKSLSSQKARSLRADLSLHVDRAMNFNWGVFVPRLAVTLEHVVNSGQHNITGYAGGRAFELMATEDDGSQMTIDVGASFVMPRGWAAYFNLQSLLLLDSYSNNTVQIGARKEF